jgi:hypothetical protein
MILFKSFDRDFEAIRVFVKSYMPISVKNTLEEGISHSINEVLLELPYVDKDFRDTYYNDFSKRFLDIERDSVRLHLFYNKSDISSDNYAGFITLRDTKIFTIGRSFLSPKALTGFSEGYYCLADYSVQISGIDLSVKAFPWMQQDGNVSRCAHIAAWGIIRYFSQKYKYYAEKTLNEIISAHESATRRIPSKGVTIEQIAQILFNNRFTPEIYFRESYPKEEQYKFDRLIYTFIESGIPYIAGLLEQQHAIAVIGHGPVSELHEVIDGDKGIIDSSSFVDEVIVSDDNYLPYRKVFNYENKPHYSFSNIDVIIIPFYQKMYLEANRLYDFILPKIESEVLEINNDDTVIRRVLLTSSRSYKRFIQKNCQDEVYRSLQLTAQMPYFIWMAEYSSTEEYTQRLISKRVIFDATMLNFHDTVYLSIKKEDEIRIKTKSHAENENLTIKLKNTTDGMYINNLGRIQ